MSYTRVLVALAVAAVLAFAAVLLLRGGGGEAGGDGHADFSFDPARAVELHVAYLDGRSEHARTERLVREAGGSAWQVEWQDADGSAAAWPAAGAQVRAGLRILSMLAARPAETGSRLELPAAELRIVMDDGEHRLMRLSGRALAGRVLAEIGDHGRAQAVWIDRDVLDMLVGAPGAAGLRAWRDPSALPGAGADVSRATFEGGGAGLLAIGRVQGRWALRQPLAEVAEPEAIARLFSSLGNVRIIDFLDGTGHASLESGGTTGAASRAGWEYGLDEPVAKLTLESDVRDAASPGAPVSVVRRTLAVGHTADLAGRNVFARVRQETVRGGKGDVLFDRIVIVSADALAAIVMDPAAYVSRRTFSAPASDVGGVVMEMGGDERRYQRTIDGWRIWTAEGELPLSRDEAEGFAALLRLVMDAPAARVVLADAAADPAAVLEVWTLGGDPIGTCLLLLSDDGEHLIVASRGVMRLHDAQGHQAVLRWLRGR